MLPHCADADAAAPNGSPPRVLVMDDDPLFRSLLAAMLKQDYLVAAAADGADGFYKALECPPDIAVIDIQMPIWDGLRTLGAFRENESLKHVALLVLTSDASKETVLAAIAAGADDYMIKSGLSRADFLQKLLRIRSRRQTWNAGVAESPACDDASPPISTSRRGLQELIDSWE